MEPTPDLYIQHMVQVFREVKRVLRKDGTVFLNLGDSYISGKESCFNPGGGKDSLDVHANLKNVKTYNLKRPNLSDVKSWGLKPKDLTMIPARAALALQADGWWLRSDIVWHKPNPMPESVNDRPTKAHEYVFLLTKSATYYYDADAIKEPASPESHARYARGRSDRHKWADGGPGNQSIAKSLEHMRKPGVNPKAQRTPVGWQTGPGSHDKIPKGRYRPKQNESFSHAVKDLVEFRNKRTVWTIPTEPTPEAHFATFPEKLVEPCILAGCPKNGVVLDTFMGSGKTLRVAKRLYRRAIGIELNPEYCEMPLKYLKQDVFQF